MENELGLLIKHRREQQKISTRKLSEAVGKSPTYIWQLENGNVKNPPYDVLKKIFDMLEISESVLINHFGIIPPEVEEENFRQYEEEVEREEELHRIYSDDMVKRLQRMSSDDIATLLLMLDKYIDVIYQLSNLHQYKPKVADSVREYVDFLHKKYIDNMGD